MITCLVLVNCESFTWFLCFVGQVGEKKNLELKVELRIANVLSILSDPETAPLCVNFED